MNSARLDQSTSSASEQSQLVSSRGEDCKPCAVAVAVAAVSGAAIDDDAMLMQRVYWKELPALPQWQRSRHCGRAGCNATTLEV